jgi:hypothetical protein
MVLARCRMPCPGWSEGRIEDEIESRLLHFRDYVQGTGSATDETLKPDWTIVKIYGEARKLFVIWHEDAAVGPNLPREFT